MFDFDDLTPRLSRDEPFGIPSNKIVTEEESLDYDEDDFELEMSPLNRCVERDGKTVELFIYRGEDGAWILEIEDEGGGSAIWEGIETDQKALDFALEKIDKDGIDSVIVEKERVAKMHKLNAGKFWKRIRKKAKRGFTGDPLITIAFYGPDNTRASKIVVAIYKKTNEDPIFLEKWFADDERDLRQDEEKAEIICKLITEWGIKSIAMRESLLGCPHEEIEDYPESESCPLCPFWAGRDRWKED
jgi:hypothetical protein